MPERPVLQVLPASEVLTITPAAPTAMQWLPSAQLMSTSTAETAVFCTIQRPAGGDDAAPGSGVASGDSSGSKGTTVAAWGSDGMALKGQRGASDRTAPVTATSVTIAMNSDGVCQRIAGRLRSCPS